MRHLAQLITTPVPTPIPHPTQTLFILEYSEGWRGFVEETQRLRAFDARTGQPTGVVIKGLARPKVLLFNRDTQNLLVAEQYHIPGQVILGGRIVGFNSETGRPTGFRVGSVGKVEAYGAAYDSSAQTLYILLEELRDDLSTDTQLRALASGRPALFIDPLFYAGLEEIRMPDVLDTLSGLSA